MVKPLISAKILLLQFVVITAITCSRVFGAEYNGTNIDGEEFDCSAYSYSTGKYYDVIVEFDGDEAYITFGNGGRITLTLSDEVIDDPNSIEAYDYNKGVYWELNVEGLD